MGRMGRFRLAAAAIVAAALGVASVPGRCAPPRHQAAGASALEYGLGIVRPGAAAPLHLDLADALRALKIPSVSIALIDHGTLARARAYGDATTRTRYQAASLSKLVTAIGALRLVQQGRLDLDRDVNDELASWQVPRSDLAREHKVTLRGLLSMTGGIGVAGYIGYEPGARLPTLAQILDGAPPANSAPVRVEHVPGTVYAYSGGGFEIVQALIEQATHQPFARAMQDLVLGPAGMTDSSFTQPLPPALAAGAAGGHDANGAELAGRWRVIPELAAGGLWSTPTDLAKLLIGISRAYRGESGQVLDPDMARALVTRQNGGPYGLGAAVAGSGRDLVLMKRGQNVGYQGYALIFPQSGQGIVVMTGSDNGTILASALIRRAARVFGWPPLGALAD